MLPSSRLQVAITPVRRRTWARRPPTSLSLLWSSPCRPGPGQTTMLFTAEERPWDGYSTVFHLLWTFGLFPVWGCYKCNSWECSQTAYVGACSLLAGRHPGVRLLDWMVLYWPTYFSFAYFELHVNEEYCIHSCALWLFTLIHGARCSSLLLFVALEHPLCDRITTCPCQRFRNMEVPHSPSWVFHLQISFGKLDSFILTLPINEYRVSGT